MCPDQEAGENSLSCRRLCLISSEEQGLPRHETDLGEVDAYLSSAPEKSSARSKQEIANPMSVLCSEPGHILSYTCDMV